jgi:hypothetical protein
VRIGLGSIYTDQVPVAGQQLTLAECMPYSCFADGGTNTAMRAACADQGFLSARGCVDSNCAPYRSFMPPDVCPCNLLASGCPSSPAAPPASIPSPIPPIPVVTTPTVAAPLPSLTSVTAPVFIPEQVPSCSLWCVVNGAIDDNPWIAGGLLALAAFFVFSKKGGRR